MKLLVIQKNELYDIIEAYRLSPSLFTLKEVKSKMSEGHAATVLQLNNSNFHFIFETYDSDSPYVYYSPAEGKYANDNHADDWRHALIYFQEWLEVLIHEIKAEDKWSRLETEIKGLNLKLDDDQEKFSAQEFEQLQSKIFLLKDGINNIGLPTEQCRVLNEKLDHLLQLATEMNKFDWKSLFIGTIVSIIIQLSVTQDNAFRLWNLIKQIFNNYFLP